MQIAQRRQRLQPLHGARPVAFYGDVHRLRAPERCGDALVVAPKDAVATEEREIVGLDLDARRPPQAERTQRQAAHQHDAAVGDRPAANGADQLGDRAVSPLGRVGRGRIGQQQQRGRDQQQRDGDDGGDAHHRVDAEVADRLDRVEDQRRAAHHGGEPGDGDRQLHVLHGGAHHGGARTAGLELAVVAADDVDGIGDADRHEERRQDQRTHGDRAAGERHHAGGPHDADDHAGERQQHAAQGAELDDQHDDDQQQRQRHEGRQIPFHQARPVDFQGLHAGDGKALAAALRRDGAAHLPFQVARQELGVAERLEQHDDGGGARIGRHQAADVQRVAKDSGAQGLRLLRRARQRAHQRADTDAALLALGAFHGGEAEHLTHAVHLRQAARQSVDGGQGVGGEHVAKHSDERRLLAAEGGADSLVVAAVGVVGRQQILDRAVDPDARRAHREHRGHRGEGEERQPRRAQRDGEPAPHPGPGQRIGHR